MKRTAFLICCLLSLYSCKKDPVASFEIVGATRAGGTITFVNNSTHADKYLWDFGDGGSTTAIRPTHVYEKRGSYTATLTAKGEGGITTASKFLSITGTTYSFVNNCSADLPYFCSFYWSGSTLYDFKDLGLLQRGAETPVYASDRAYINFGYIINEHAIVSEDFTLVHEAHNQLVIDDSTMVYFKKNMTAASKGPAITIQDFLK